MMPFPWLLKLENMPLVMTNVVQPIALIILDGWGLRCGTNHNGIALAQKPNFDFYWKNYPHTELNASGPAVGLPQGIMGNSEVGHMNIGAGRIIYSGLSQIYQAIENGSFFRNEIFLQAIKTAKEKNVGLHLMGLVSDGAVHSHQDHLYALLELAKKKGLTKVYVHCFLDGRDTAPNDGEKCIRQLEEKIKQIGVGTIASVMGRFYAMDRDKRWERIEKAYEVLVGLNKIGKTNALSIVHESYQKGIYDEFIVPQAVVDGDGFPVGAISDQDVVIFFNFRADRAREITRILTDSHFQEIPRKFFPELSCFVCMTLYDASFSLPVAFVSSHPTQTLGEIVSENGLKQLRIAETEKYAHVTFFFNGGCETVFEGEDHVLIPSPREVPTYDLKPEMSAYQVKDELIKLIAKNKYQFIVLNFANSDMVGHTAKPDALIKAVQVVDECLGEIIPSILNQDGIVLITADHGNAEQMVDNRGAPHTSHTLNPVPFILIDSKKSGITLKSSGRLCDIAPTILDLWDFSKPKVMQGVSLIES